MMTEPGPNPAELEAILTAAARVPDHKKLIPWRFIVFEGEARADFGRVLLKALQAEEREAPSAARLETERTRLMRAPTVVAVISRVTPIRRPQNGSRYCPAVPLASIFALPPMPWASVPPGSRNGLPIVAPCRQP